MRNLMFICKAITNMGIFESRFGFPGTDFLTQLFDNRERLFDLIHEFARLVDFPLPTSITKNANRIVVLSHDAGFGHRTTAEAIAQECVNRGFEVTHIHMSAGGNVKDELTRVAQRIAEIGPAVIFSTAYDKMLWNKILGYTLNIPIVDVVTDFDIVPLSFEQSRNTFSPSGERRHFRAVPHEALQMAYSTLALQKQAIGPIVFLSTLPKFQAAEFILGYPTRFDPVVLTDEEKLEVRRTVFAINHPDVVADLSVPVVTILYSEVAPRKRLKEISDMLHYTKEEEEFISEMNDYAFPVKDLLKKLEINDERVTQRIHIHVIFGRGEEKKEEFDCWKGSLDNDQLGNISFSSSGYTDEMDKVYAATDVIMTFPSGAISAEIFSHKHLKVIWISQNRGVSSGSPVNQLNSQFFSVTKIGSRTSADPHADIIRALEDKPTSFDMPSWKEELPKILDEISITHAVEGK